MVERVLCKHEVVGSIPSDSTIKPSGAAIAEFKFPSQLSRAAGGKSDIVN